MTLFPGIFPVTIFLNIANYVINFRDREMLFTYLENSGEKKILREILFLGLNAPFLSQNGTNMACLKMVENSRKI